MRPGHQGQGRGARVVTPAEEAAGQVAVRIRQARIGETRAARKFQSERQSWGQLAPSRLTCMPRASWSRLNPVNLSTATRARCTRPIAPPRQPGGATGLTGSATCRAQVACRWESTGELGTHTCFMWPAQPAKQRRQICCSSTAQHGQPIFCTSSAPSSSWPTCTGGLASLSSAAALRLRATPLLPSSPHSSCERRKTSLALRGLQPCGLKSVCRARWRWQDGFAGFASIACLI